MTDLTAVAGNMVSEEIAVIAGYWTQAATSTVSIIISSIPEIVFSMCKIFHVSETGL